MLGVLSEKGRITIPKELRDQLGLALGTVMEFTVEKGRLIGCKMVPADFFARWRGRGRLPMGTSTDEYLERVRS